jgi:hypothetical protein
MSKALAKQAEIGLTDKSSVSEAGMCQKFQRQQIMATYGQKKYEKYFQKYMKPSAYETMMAFKKSPYAITPDPDVLGGGSVVGDILYKGRKTSGKFGHVGTRIAGNKVAENSSSHVNPAAADRDARGTRSLASYGAFELIVRLPEPDKLK